MSRNKKAAIDLISELYPIDSQFQSTNEIGKQLMLESIEETGFNWRELPEDVLVRWAEKCEAKERDADFKMIQKYK